MTDPMELVGRLERNSKQTITRYCGDLSGAIVPHDLLTEAAACIREMVAALEIAEASMDGNCVSAHRIGLNAVRQAIGNGTRADLPPAPGAEA